MENSKENMPGNAAGASKEDEMSADIKARMNHFYYAQCIASVERAVCEGNKQEVKRICHSRFFRELLEKEKAIKANLWYRLFPVKKK